MKVLDQFGIVGQIDAFVRGREKRRRSYVVWFLCQNDFSVVGSWSGLSEFLWCVLVWIAVYQSPHIFKCFFFVSFEST